MHGAVLVAAASLVAVFAYFLLATPRADGDAGWRIGAGIALTVSALMVVVSALRLIRHRPYFIIYEHGFEYAPGGVSTGIIRWADVVELREETVLHGDAGFPTRRAVTAVVLRNPEEYQARFPTVLRPLLQMRQAMNSSVVLIPRGEFGGDDVALVEIMREQVAKAQASPNRHE